MNRRKSKVLLVCVLIIGASQLGSAAPVHWEQNGHYYEVISAPAGISWGAAQAAAEAKGGYLATITSAEENQFVFDLTVAAGVWFPSAEWFVGPWLGGSDAASEGNWEWVTGEPWGYTSWLTGQPDNWQDEDYLLFWGRGSITPTWNDGDIASSYVIEYDSKPLTIEIVGPSTAVVSNLTDRKTRVRPPSLEAVVTSGVKFKGGKYEWTILSGEDKVQLMGDTWDNRIVKVQPIKESSTLNDVMIRASYTVGGQASYGDHFMTVLKPIALELLWEEHKTELNKDGQIIDYETTYWYRAIDQFVQPISIERMYVREALELLPGYTYNPGKVTEWTGYTDSSGIFRDCLAPFLPNRFFKGPIPLDYYVSFKQIIFVEGWDVATRRLTYHYNEATSEPWTEP